MKYYQILSINVLNIIKYKMYHCIKNYTKINFTNFKIYCKIKNNILQKLSYKNILTVKMFKYII